MECKRCQHLESSHHYFEYSGGLYPTACYRCRCWAYQPPGEPRNNDAPETTWTNEQLNQVCQECGCRFGSHFGYGVCGCGLCKGYKDREVKSPIANLIRMSKRNSSHQRRTSTQDNSKVSSTGLVQFSYDPATPKWVEIKSLIPQSTKIWRTE